MKATKGQDIIFAPKTRKANITAKQYNSLQGEYNKKHLEKSQGVFCYYSMLTFIFNVSIKFLTFSELAPVNFVLKSFISQIKK